MNACESAYAAGVPNSVGIGWASNASPEFLAVGSSHTPVKNIPLSPDMNSETAVP